jgi:hypothetical protein
MMMCPPPWPRPSMPSRTSSRPSAGYVAHDDDDGDDDDDDDTEDMVVVVMMMMIMMMMCPPPWRRPSMPSRTSSHPSAVYVDRR